MTVQMALIQDAESLLIRAIRERIRRNNYPDGSEEYYLDGKLILRLGPVKFEQKQGKKGVTMVVSRASETFPVNETHA